jgi:hypothetical protein
MFVPFGDAIYIQLGIGKDGENIIPCVKSHCSRVVQCRCTSARTIYIVQTEDMHCYSTQFQTIPALRGQKDLPSMMVWSLTAMPSSIRELWHAVDNIVVPFRFDQWEGHILTWVQKQCFSYESIHKDPRSPIDTLQPLNILKKFRSLYPDYHYDPADVYHGPSSYFGYSDIKVRRLFSPQRSLTVHMCSSIKDVLELNESSINHFNGKNIIICVALLVPESFLTTTMTNNLF